MTPSPSNQILDEIDRAHRGLSPPAQQALEQVHGQLFGQPAAPGLLPTTPTEAPRPMAAPTAAAKSPFPASTSPEGSALMGGEAATGPRPMASPLQAAHDRYQQLAESPSGIGGIKSPWARIPLQVLQGIGASVLPATMMNIPGTDLHHQLLLHQAAKGVNQEESVANEESKRQLEEAQTEHARAQAEAVTHPKPGAAEFEQGHETGVDPAHPELGNQLMSFNKQTGKWEYGGIKAGVKPATEKEGELPLGAERVAQLNELLGKRDAAYKLPADATQKDFDRVQKLMELDLRDAESKAVHAQSASDREAAREQALELKKLAMAAAQANKDHGENYVDPATGKLVRVQPGQPIPQGGLKPGQASGQQVAENKEARGVEKTAQQTQKDYEFAQQAAAHPSPTNDYALLLHFIGATKPESLQKLRLNQQEVKLALGTRSSLGDLDALLNRVVNGQMITATQRQDMVNTMKLVADSMKRPAGGGTGPKAGDVENGYRFKGGDPGKKENWEKQ